MNHHFLKVMAGTAATMLAIGGLSVIAAAPASAHGSNGWHGSQSTFDASATCDLVSYDADGYDTKPGKDAKTKWVIDKPGQQYVAPTFEVEIVTPAVAEVAEVAEVSHTEVKWEKWNWTDKKMEHVWATDDPGKGWKDSGESKVVIDVAYVAPQDAVTKLVEVDPGQPFIEATYKEAVVEAAVPAVATPNTVTVTVDGKIVQTKEFGTAASGTFTFDSKFVAHDWSVSITAWNDSSGHKGMTKTIDGTSTACDMPIVKANPVVSIDTSCGLADVTLTNVPGTDTIARSYKVDIWVDGKKVDRNVKVESGKTVTKSYPFAEDSGSHEVVVQLANQRNGHGGGYGYGHGHDRAALVSAAVTADCISPDATAAVNIGEANCDADGMLTLGDIANAEFGDISHDGLNYSVTATAMNGHTFADGETTMVFSGTLAAQLTGDACAAVVPPVTKPMSPVMYPVPPVMTAVSPTKQLASTGTNAPVYCELALAILGIGAAAVVFGARRRRNA